ncbi:hypothetical protein HPB47_004250 [Ixodes persulcatus]|uniref:Uncharacterized protein n=1 Tax=Ixodes persulcatus TaxID=34615 RepID=A0AC60PGC7_IXOPE|nr:hypothetical protein HPB47_004250 [Ixodes persulcatus]
MVGLPTVGLARSTAPKQTASRKDDLEPTGGLQGLLLDALKRILFLTDHVASLKLGDENKRLRTVVARASERQSTGIVDVVGYFDNVVCQGDDEAGAGAECGGVRRQEFRTSRQQTQETSLKRAS